MTIIKEGKPPHECELPPPSEHARGTVAECPRCRRRWKLRREGVTFLNWHLTLASKVTKRGRAKHRWASIQRT